MGAALGADPGLRRTVLVRCTATRSAAAGRRPGRSTARRPEGGKWPRASRETTRSADHETILRQPGPPDRHPAAARRGRGRTTPPAPRASLGRSRPSAGRPPARSDVDRQAVVRPLPHPPAPVDSRNADRLGLGTGLAGRPGPGLYPGRPPRHRYRTHRRRCGTLQRPGGDARLPAHGPLFRRGPATLVVAPAACRTGGGGTEQRR